MKKLLLLIICLSMGVVYGAEQNIIVELLHHHPEAIPAVVDIWYEGIVKKTHPVKPDAAMEKYLRETHMHENTISLAYVALDNDIPVGICCLRKDGARVSGIFPWVDEHPEATPWVCGLVVTPEYQKRGIAKQLIAAIRTKARDLGYKNLYLAAEADNYELIAMYERKGCTKIAESTFRDNPIVVMQASSEK